MFTFKTTFTLAGSQNVDEEYVRKTWAHLIGIKNHNTVIVTQEISGVTKEFGDVLSQNRRQLDTPVGGDLWDMPAHGDENASIANTVFW